MRILPLVLAGGALMAAVAACSTQSRRKAAVTFFVLNQILPGDVEALAGAADALSPKVLNGTSTDPRYGTPEILGYADQIGAARWGWGYHFCRTPAEAVAEGTAAGVAAALRGLAVYGVDLESEWSGTGTNSNGVMYPVTANPESQALRFIEAFVKANGGITRPWWNGYSFSYSDFNVKHNRGPRVALFSEKVAAAISAAGGGYMPQCYFTKQSTRIHPVNGIAYRVNRQSAYFSPATRCPMLGTQRVDSNGVQWGEWFRADGAGDAQIIAPAAEWVTSFYGTGSAGRIQGTKPRDPSLRNLMLKWKGGNLNG